MTNPDVEADWLQDTLAKVARKLRQPGVSAAKLAECASILERIVGDLQGKPPLEQPPVPAIDRRTRWWITVAIGFGLYLLMKRLFKGDCNS